MSHIAEQPIPQTVADCAVLVQGFGLRLARFAGPELVFELYDDRPETPVLLQRFAGTLWSELDCAQAAARFARYFFTPNYLNGHAKNGAAH